MKKIALASLLIFAWLVSPAHAALRGSGGCIITSGSTCAVTVSGFEPQNGDVILVGSTQCTSGTQTISSPGFAAISGVSNQSLQTNHYTYAMLEKIAGASEPTSYTFTTSSNGCATFELRVYSGRSGTITASQVTLMASTTTTLTLALTGVTAAAGDDVAVLGGCDAQTGATTTYTYTPSAGYSNGATAQSTTAYVPLTFGSDDVNVSAGATGTIAGTIASTSNFSTQCAGAVISLAAGAVVASGAMFLSQ